MSEVNPYFVFLDHIRESGVTNMMGAIPWMLRHFEELDRQTASTILNEWMKTK